MIIDIFSRYVVGWMLARAEWADLSKRLINDTVAKQGIERDQLTLHSDRGSPMIAKQVVHLLADLGVTKSTAGPMCQMTTRIQNHSSGPLSTDPTSLIASAATRMPGPTAADFSLGITTIIATRALDFMSPPTSTTAEPKRSENNAASSCSTPMANTLNVSSARFRLHRPFRPSRGSINPKRRPRLTKSMKKSSQKG